MQAISLEFATDTVHEYRLLRGTNLPASGHGLPHSASHSKIALRLQMIMRHGASTICTAGSRTLAPIRMMRLATTSEPERS